MLNAPVNLVDPSGMDWDWNPIDDIKDAAEAGADFTQRVFEKGAKPVFNAAKRWAGNVADVAISVSVQDWLHRVNRPVSIKIYNLSKSIYSQGIDTQEFVTRWGTRLKWVPAGGFVIDYGQQLWDDANSAKLDNWDRFGRAVVKGGTILVFSAGFGAAGAAICSPGVVLAAACGAGAGAFGSKLGDEFSDSLIDWAWGAKVEAVMLDRERARYLARKKVRWKAVTGRWGTSIGLRCLPDWGWWRGSPGVS